MTYIVMYFIYNISLWQVHVFVSPSFTSSFSSHRESLEGKQKKPLQCLPDISASRFQCELIRYVTDRTKRWHKTTVHLQYRWFFFVGLLLKISKILTCVNHKRLVSLDGYHTSNKNYRRADEMHFRDDYAWFIPLRLDFQFKVIREKLIMCRFQ